MLQQSVTDRGNTFWQTYIWRVKQGWEIRGCYLPPRRACSGSIADWTAGPVHPEPVWADGTGDLNIPFPAVHRVKIQLLCCLGWIHSLGRSKSFLNTSRTAVSMSSSSNSMSYSWVPFTSPLSLLLATKKRLCVVWKLWQHRGQVFSGPPTTHPMKLMFLCSVVPTLKPLVGVVVTISANFSSYRPTVRPNIPFFFCQKEPWRGLLRYSLCCSGSNTGQRKTLVASGLWEASALSQALVSLLLTFYTFPLMFFFLF